MELAGYFRNLICAKIGERMAKKNSNSSQSNILMLVLMFVAGFAVFTLLGFIILIALLSLGILPAV